MDSVPVEHNPLCPMHPGWHEGWDGTEYCACPLIAKVRADAAAVVAETFLLMWDEWLHDLQQQVVAKRDEAQAIVDDLGLPAAYVAKIRALAFAEVVGLLDGGGSDGE